MSGLLRYLYDAITFVSKVAFEILGWLIRPFYGGEYAADTKGGPALPFILFVFTMIIMLIMVILSRKGVFDRLRAWGWVAIAASTFVMFGEYPNLIFWLISQGSAVSALFLLPHLNFLYYKEVEVKERKKEGIIRAILLFPVRLLVKLFFSIKKLWNKFKNSKAFLALKEGWDEERQKEMIKATKK